MKKKQGKFINPPAARRARHARGAVMDTILLQLAHAGQEGLTVKQLIEKTGHDRRTVDGWLWSASAKNTKGFKKIGKAHYRYVSPPAAKNDNDKLVN